MSNTNPIKRTSRTRRAAVIRHMRNLREQMPNANDRLHAAYLVERLEAVRKCDWAPGAWKDRRFKAILSRPE